MALNVTSSLFRLRSTRGADTIAVHTRRALRYAEGADAAIDRPAHVRAGSGCCFIDGTRTLVVVQDDAHFLALVDVDTGVARSIALPAGPGGLRQFDAQRGNKKLKMDLESCVVIDGRIFLLGSGSTRERERIVVVDPDSGAARICNMHALYQALRDHPLMEGAELNIEGALHVENRLRLFQRGNGVGGINATFDVAWPVSDPPRLLEAKRWDLGEINGVPLTFTDATRVGDRVVVLAVAENSPNTYDDGEVVGCAIGFIDGDKIALHRIPFDEKPEGIAADPTRPGIFWLVTDRDDPAAPSELLAVSVS